MDRHFGLDASGPPLVCGEHILDAMETGPAESFLGTPNGQGHYWIDLLSGSDRLRTMIEAGENAEAIRASWQDDIAALQGAAETVSAVRRIAEKLRSSTEVIIRSCPINGDLFE